MLTGGEDVITGGEDVITGGEDVITGGEDVITGGESVITKAEEKKTELNPIFSLVCLSGFLTSSLTTRQYRGRAPRLTSDNFRCCHTRGRTGRP